MGESGSGKSTLGRLVLRLIEPSSGSLQFEGRDLLAASHREMRRLRRDMQIIFQDPFGSLDPRMNVEDIISEPLVIHEAMSLTARRARVAELLARLASISPSCPGFRTNSAADSGSALGSHVRWRCVRSSSLRTSPSPRSTSAWERRSSTCWRSCSASLA